MKGILLVSHGGLAKGMKESIEMITGHQENLRYVGIEPHEDGEQFEKKMIKEEEALGEVDKILIFCDLFGGTPCNIAMKNYYQDEKYIVISGMNSPMILSAILNEEINKNNIISDAIKGIIDLKDMSLEDCEEE